MRILAIDPGYERLGIAILERTPGSRKEVLVHSDCFKTPASLPFPERLWMIGQAVGKTIETYDPTALAIETLLWGANAKTAIKVAEARGVVLYEAASRGLAVYEYTPQAIKLAAGGYGGSRKKEVASLIHRLIDIQKPIKYDDELDAIAIGITCFATERNL
jgi:crossover junction endodeoxyribonuclease RuvC